MALLLHNNGQDRNRSVFGNRDCFTDKVGPQLHRGLGVAILLDGGQQLVQLVEDTGGGDLFISNSGESGDSVTESYTSGVRTEGRLDIAQGETRRELTFGESLPPDGFGEDLHVWRIAVCIITYVLYAVLATVVYYRRITLLPQWNFYGIPPYRGPGRADA